MMAVNIMDGKSNQRIQQFKEFSSNIFQNCLILMRRCMLLVELMQGFTHYLKKLLLSFKKHHASQSPTPSILWSSQIHTSSCGTFHSGERWSTRPPPAMLECPANRKTLTDSALERTPLSAVNVKTKIPQRTEAFPILIGCS